MQSHNCAKYFRICANFGLMNAIQEKLALISCIFFYKFNKVFLVSHVLRKFECLFMPNIFNQSIFWGWEDKVVEVVG